MKHLRIIGPALVLLAASSATAQAPPPSGPAAQASAPAAQPPAAQAPAAAPPAATPQPPVPPEGAEPLVMTVKATRRVAGSDTVIGQQQLERFERDDPHRVLLSVPGVYVRQEDGFGLRPNVGLRGANAERSKKVTLTEDGVLFGPAPYSAPAAYYFPLMTRMVAVRVVKGPSAVTMGPQTIGGAIDLRTRSIPSSPGGEVDVALGSFLYRKVHAHYGVSTEQAGLLIEGVHLGSDGFKELDGGGDTGFHRNEWMVKGRYTLDPTARVQHDFTVKLGYSDEVSNETYLGLTDADFRATPYRRYAGSQLALMEWQRTQAQLSHTVRFDRLRMTTTVYRHDLTRSWDKLNAVGSLANPLNAAAVLQDPGRSRDLLEVLRGNQDSLEREQLLIGPNHRTFVSQGVQTVASYRLRTGPVKHSIQYGLRVHQDQVERRHTQQAYDMRGGELLPAAEPNPLQTTRHNNDSTLAAALWVRDEVLVGPLALSPGVRVEVIHWRSRNLERDPSYAPQGDNFTSDSYAVVSPGAGAYYAITRRLGALAGVYRGFSPVVPGSEASDPETSTNYEGGFRYVRPGSRAELIGFFNDYDNLTFVCGFSAGCAADNIDSQFDAGSAHIYGLEAQLDTTVELGGGLSLPLRGAYTFTRAIFQRSFRSDNPQWGDVEEGDEMPYVPEHQLAAGVGLEQNRWRVNVAGTYVAAMREEAGQAPLDESLATDAYFLLDLSGAVQVTRQMEVYANLRNTLGSDYIASRRPFGARPGAPRTVVAGAKLTF